MVPFKCADKLVLESTNQPNKPEGLGDDDFEFVFNAFYVLCTKMWLITICFVGYSHGYGYYVYNIF